LTASPTPLIADLFRRESGRLVAALTRRFGPAHLPLVEDAVHDALIAAMQAWRLGMPQDPTAWLLQTAKNRAIDVLRREKRLVALPSEDEEKADLSPQVDAANQLAMMFAICDAHLGKETHVSLILRLLCGLSPAEIARAFLVDTQTVDRRLHRGRARLRALGGLGEPDDVAARQPSVLQALYLLFNEGFQGSDAENPLHPALCADALRLAELLLAAPRTATPETYALASLFCFHAARLPTRLDAEGVYVPLAEQDRTRWDRALIERGIVHLSRAAHGDRLTRWHLEAGIACEHALAATTPATNWARVVELYDALLGVEPGPVVALNRALAVAELRGVDAGSEALHAIAGDGKLARYPFFWAALADLERRAGRTAAALYRRAIALARNDAERFAFERKLR
jgi:RNA polymerase sigma factor (sigma-70 family)